MFGQLFFLLGVVLILKIAFPPIAEGVTELLTLVIETLISVIEGISTAAA